MIISDNNIKFKENLALYSPN